MEIKVVKLHPKATFERKTEGSVGYDIAAAIDGTVRFAPGDIKLIPTGIIVEPPEDHYFDLALRSSMPKKGFAIPNGFGAIDLDYRGEVCIWLQNITTEYKQILPGERIGQLILRPAIFAEVKFVSRKELSETKRGEGGFGHTGR